MYRHSHLTTNGIRLCCLAYLNIKLLIIIINIIIHTKEGSPAHSNKNASIPPRAEPGTMQLHTTRPADGPTLEQETQTCQLTFFSERHDDDQYHPLPRTSMFRRILVSSAGLESTNATRERHSETTDTHVRRWTAPEVRCISL